MMMQREHRGFTLVELMVIIVVIGILTAIISMAYNQIQKQGKDGRRQSDISVMQNELEKFYSNNGVYPPGCPALACSDPLFTNNTSSLQFNTTTTISQIRSVMPAIPATFSDPSSLSKDTPFTLRSGTEKEYYYFGGSINTSGATASYQLAGSSAFPCSIKTSLNPGEVGSYILGYYSEATAKWILKAGKSSVPLIIYGGNVSDGCVINS
ncbi:MAG: type II secretion system protein [Candidatus Saccharimonadales bacterium]